MKHWLAVVSREHVLRGVAGGFAQVCHGKKAPLARMKAGDGLVYYSPSERMKEKDGLQSFTAIGRIAEGEAFAVQMSEDFSAFRKRVVFSKARQVQLAELRERLALTKNENWGYQLRRGLVEISVEDFKMIAEVMDSKV